MKIAGIGRRKDHLCVGQPGRPPKQDAKCWEVPDHFPFRWTPRTRRIRGRLPVRRRRSGRRGEASRSGDTIGRGIGGGQWPIAASTPPTRCGPGSWKHIGSGRMPAPPRRRSGRGSAPLCSAALASATPWAMPLRSLIRGSLAKRAIVTLLMKEVAMSLRMLFRRLFKVKTRIHWERGFRTPTALAQHRAARTSSGTPFTRSSSSGARPSTRPAPGALSLRKEGEHS